MSVLRNPQIDLYGNVAQNVFYLEDGVGIFQVVGDPEGLVAANAGSIAVDNAGNVYRKTTDLLATGWQPIGGGTLPGDIIDSVVNLVNDEGGIGNGSTDNSVALQNFLDAQGYLYIPPGVFEYSTTLVLPVCNETSSIMMLGAGITKSILRYTGTGNAIEGPDGRVDHVVMNGFKIVCTNGGQTGDGINFSGTSDVETRLTLDDVAVFGANGWGFYSVNVQSSQINNCHFRENTKGAIAIVDTNLMDPLQVPNANLIQGCLLDNSFQDASNVAMLYLFSSNGTRVASNTIQGHWIGATGNKPAIHIEQCYGVTLENNWIEAGTAVNAAGIFIKNSQAIKVISPRGSGSHAWDIEGQNARGISIDNASYLTPQTHFKLDGNCRRWTAKGGIYSSAANIQKEDDSFDGIAIEGPIIFDQITETFVKYISDWSKSHEPSTLNLLINGSFANDISSWTGAAVGMTRSATGAPPNNGPYVLCDTQALSDGGQLGSTNFTQTISIPDFLPPGMYTLSFDFKVNSLGIGTDALRFLDVEFAGSSFSGGTNQFRIQNQDTTLEIDRWYRASISDILNTGTGRNIRVSINPTQGPNTPTCIFANLKITPGCVPVRDGSPVSVEYPQQIDGAKTFKGTQTFDGVIDNNGVITNASSLLVKSAAFTFNTGTGEDDLDSYTIAGGVLKGGADCIRFHARGEFAANANNKRVRIRLGGQLAFDSGAVAINGGNWQADVWVIRLGTDTEARVLTTFQTNSTLLPIAMAKTDLSGLNDFDVSTNIFKFTAEATSDLDIRQSWLTGELFRSNP